MMINKDRPMTQSADYKLGYSRGYAKGRGDLGAEESRHQAELLAVAKRAERAETAAGMGHCEGCANWERPEGCAWGYCNATRQPGSPWGCWHQGPAMRDTRELGRVTTTPLFGCILFAANEPGATNG